MAQIQFTIDDRDIREASRQLGAMSRLLPQILANAMNRALAPSKKAMLNGIQQATTLKRGRAAQAIGQYRANKNQLVAYLRFGRQRGIGARNFRHMVTAGNGVAIQPMRHQPPIRFRHAFVGTGLNGNRHVFVRDVRRPKGIVKRAHHKPNVGKKRHYLKVIYGPTVRAIVEKNPKIVEAVNAVASDVIRKRIYAEIDFRLKRGKTAVPVLDSL